MEIEIASNIFISYRREDSRGSAGRLYDQLASHFGRERIFMDVDTIEPGLDFVDAIESAVSETDVQIVVIGPNWLHVTDAAGNRRIDNPEDFIRLEVASALKRNIRVIPVLVDRATMPNSTDLPEDIKFLSRRNALEISHSRFNLDVQRLIPYLEKALSQAEFERKQQAEAERKQQAEAKRKQQAETERKQQAEAERKQQAEAERKQKAETERRQQAEAERKEEVENNLVDEEIGKIESYEMLSTTDNMQDVLPVESELKSRRSFSIDTPQKFLTYWLIATVIGYVIGFVIVAAIYNYSNPKDSILAMIAFVVCISSTQWFVLRFISQYAWIWIFASVIFMTIAYGATFDIAEDGIVLIIIWFLISLAVGYILSRRNPSDTWGKN